MTTYRSMRKVKAITIQVLVVPT